MQISIPIRFLLFNSIEEIFLKIFIAYILTILILASIDFELYGYLGFFNFSTADGLQIIIIIVETVILILPAFKGNEWTISNLIDQGYKVSYSVQASSKKEALQLAQNKHIGWDLIKKIFLYNHCYLKKIP